MLQWASGASRMASGAPAACTPMRALALLIKLSDLLVRQRVGFVAPAVERRLVVSHFRLSVGLAVSGRSQAGMVRRLRMPKVSRIATASCGAGSRSRYRHPSQSPSCVTRQKLSLLLAPLHGRDDLPRLAEAAKHALARTPGASSARLICN
jgi:hypothetical protein